MQLTLCANIHSIIMHELLFNLIKVARRCSLRDLIKIKLLEYNSDLYEIILVNVYNESE